MTDSVGCKWLATPNNSPFIKKKMKYINAKLFPDNYVKPLLDILWEVLNDCHLKSYFKLQSTIKKYTYAIKSFLCYLGLVIYNLYLD